MCEQLIFEGEITPFNNLILPNLPISLLEYLNHRRISPLAASLPGIKQYTINLAVQYSQKLFGLQKKGLKQKQFFAVFKSVQDALTEAKMHKRLDPLNCSYIIKLQASIGITQLESLIITPLYNPFSFEELRPYTKLVVHQLLQALKVCHDNKIAHRDIKPDNIVWTWDEDKPHIYLTDFGISLHVEEDRDVAAGRGTVDYMPPELYYFGMQGDYRTYDIWGAGLVMAEMLLNKPRIMKGDHDMEKWNQMKDEWFREVDPKAYDLVLKMLAEEPKDRILVDDALAHAYFDEVREVHQSNKKRKHDCIDSNDESLGTSECRKKIKTKAEKSHE